MRAISATGPSPHAQAPPLGDLPKRYPVEHLAEPLVEGIVVSHGEMPEFLFEPEVVEELFAYIASLAKQPGTWSLAHAETPERFVRQCEDLPLPHTAYGSTRLPIKSYTS